MNLSEFRLISDFVNVYMNIIIYIQGIKWVTMKQCSKFLMVQQHIKNDTNTLLVNSMFLNAKVLFLDVSIIMIITVYHASYPIIHTYHNKTFISSY